MIIDRPNHGPTSEARLFEEPQDHQTPVVLSVLLHLLLMTIAEVNNN